MFSRPIAKSYRPPGIEESGILIGIRSRKMRRKPEEISATGRRAVLFREIEKIIGIPQLKSSADFRNFPSGQICRDSRQL